MPGRYASQTAVPIEQSKAEIEGILRRYGAQAFSSGWGEHEGRRLEQINFVANGRAIRFSLIMPSPTDDEFAIVVVNKHRKRRTDNARIKCWEQGCRQRWRALRMCIYAKMEAIEIGISTFEDEFLAFIVDPITKRTVGQNVREQLIERYGKGAIGLPGLPAPEDFESNGAE